MIARANGSVSLARRVGRAVALPALYLFLFVGAWVLLGMVAHVIWWAVRFGWAALG